MVDRNIIRVQASFLQRALDRLHEKKPPSLKLLEKDEDLQDIILHNLQVAIQGCIDMGSHVVTDERWEVPPSAPGVFRVLKEHRVINPDLADQMVSLARLRNELVREYAHLHLDRVYEALQEGVKYLEEFRRQVCRFAKV